jgi:hypothetical protein
MLFEIASHIYGKCDKIIRLTAKLIESDDVFWLLAVHCGWF